MSSISADINRILLIWFFMEDWFIGCEVLTCGQDYNHRLEKELL